MFLVIIHYLNSECGSDEEDIDSIWLELESAVNYCKYNNFWNDQGDGSNLKLYYIYRYPKDICNNTSNNNIKYFDKHKSEYGTLNDDIINFDIYSPKYNTLNKNVVVVYETIYFNNGQIRIYPQNISEQINNKNISIESDKKIEMAVINYETNNINEISDISFIQNRLKVMNILNNFILIK